jgi:hypothetical protein
MALAVSVSFGVKTNLYSNELYAAGSLANM